MGKRRLLGMHFQVGLQPVEDIMKLNMYTFVHIHVVKRETSVSGLLPLKTHQISVIAVYQDSIETEENTQYTHSGM